MKNRLIIRPLCVAFLALAIVATSACDTLLKVENPGDVTEEGLASEEAIPVLVASAYGQLVDAFDTYVLYTGLFADELIHSGSFPTFDQMDRRAVTEDNVNLRDIWRDMQQARFLADFAVDRVRNADDPSDAQLAEGLAYAGWTRLFLAEMFCQIPMDAGPAQSPEAIMGEAETLLSESIQAAQASGEGDILNFARVGRARAQLFLGDDAGAAADANAVPEDFVFDAIYDQSANSNDVWTFTVGRRETTIGPPFRNLDEVPQCSVHPLAEDLPECTFTTEGEFGPDNETPLFVPLVYPSQSSEIPIADGRMAGWYAMEAAGTADPFEMAVDLFLTGNRLAQMRRNNDPFLSGGQSCFPLPQEELDTNPNL